MARKKTQNDFYSLAEILKRNAQYNLIYGERSNGKSYAVKKHCLEQFRDTGAQFIYVRRYERDITMDFVNGYFADMPISEIFNGEYDVIYAHGGGIFIAKMGEDGRKRHAKKIGFYRCLSNAQRYSSTSYPDVETIILEEFVAIDGIYLPDELFKFNHIISTVARREDITVFLIGNSLSRLSPYWQEYGVEDIIQNQKQGEICIVDRETGGGNQRVAIEYCRNTEGRSRMFTGLREDMTNGGKWLANEYPKLERSRDEWECLYTLVLKYKRSVFLVEILVFGNECCAYITPKTTPIKPDTRVINDTPSPLPLWTYGLKPLSPKEKPVIDLIQNCAFFANNQTGTEFNEALKNLTRRIV